MMTMTARTDVPWEYLRVHMQHNIVVEYLLGQIQAYLLTSTVMTIFAIIIAAAGTMLLFYCMDLFFLAYTFVILLEKLFWLRVLREFLLSKQANTKPSK
jgi:predicted CDP-diglyceride synthetase/phosphatidate cytidylyltransferase